MSFLLSLFGYPSSPSSPAPSRKRVRADEPADADDEAAPIAQPAMDPAHWNAALSSAKQGRVGEAADVAASREAEMAAAAAAAAADSEAVDFEARAAEAAAAAAASHAQFTRRVASVQLQSRRAMKTVELIRAISLQGPSIRSRVRSLRVTLLADASRPPSQSLLDPNFQHSHGKTLIMHIIDLISNAIFEDELASMDNDALRLRLKQLLGRTDVRIKNHKGENALSYLARHIDVNQKGDLAWWLATKLVQLASAAGVLDSRDASGVTPFLRWCQTIETPHVLQLLIDAGCDVTAATANGNNGIHRLVRRYEVGTLEALSTAKRSFVLQSWCVPNDAGETPLEMASSQRLQSLLEPASKVWTTTVAPLLMEQVTHALNGVSDVARICVEYVDGSGHPFIAAAEHEGSPAASSPSASTRDRWNQSALPRSPPSVRAELDQHHDDESMVEVVQEGGEEPNGEEQKQGHEEEEEEEVDQDNASAFAEMEEDQGEEEEEEAFDEESPGLFAEQGHLVEPGVSRSIGSPLPTRWGGPSSSDLD